MKFSIATREVSRGCDQRDLRACGVQERWMRENLTVEKCPFLADNDERSNFKDAKA
jgi:hypothetical protein